MTIKDIVVMNAKAPKNMSKAVSILNVLHFLSEAPAKKKESPPIKEMMIVNQL